MQKECTLNQLVGLLYRETSIFETFQWEDRLEQDQSLSESYNELKESYEKLPKVTFDVKPSIIQTILGYSKRSAVEPSL